MSLANFDFVLFGVGLLAGVLAAALYFAGLAWGMRRALRAARPVAVLLPSAAVRIALLLGAGWWVATWGVAAVLGFGLAFLVVRFGLLTALQPKKEVTSWK